MEADFLYMVHIDPVLSFHTGLNWMILKYIKISI